MNFNAEITKIRVIFQMFSAKTFTGYPWNNSIMQEPIPGDSDCLVLSGTSVITQRWFLKACVATSK